MSNLLSVRGVSKRFAAHTALDNVSIEVPRGRIFGLLGPNGAGKTTLIRIINHITLPTRARCCSTESHSPKKMWLILVTFPKSAASIAK